MSSRPRRRKLHPDVLEDRCTPTVNISPEEQYFIELINRARANPAAEAARFGIDLNEGLPSGTISNSPVQPLAPNAALADSIDGHLAYLASAGLLTHTGANGSMPWDRATAAGYPSTIVGENLACQTGPLSTAAVNELHRALFVDHMGDSRPHRLNLMNWQFREIGPGVATGLTPNGPGVVVRQDFGIDYNWHFITGVAYLDNVVADQFYSIGEGLGGVTVTATAPGGQTFTTS